MGSPLLQTRGSATIKSPPKESSSRRKGHEECAQTAGILSRDRGFEQSNERMVVGQLRMVPRTRYRDQLNVWE